MRGLSTTFTKPTTADSQLTTKRVESDGKWELVGNKIRLHLEIHDNTLPEASRNIVWECDLAKDPVRFVDPQKKQEYVKEGPYWQVDSPGQVTAREYPDKPGVYVLGWTGPRDPKLTGYRLYANEDLIADEKVLGPNTRTFDYVGSGHVAFVVEAYSEEAGISARSRSVEFWWP